MYKKYEKICSVTLFLLMCAGLLLLMALGWYNHPTGDDYFYAAATKQVFAETGNIFAVLAAATKGVVTEYVRWQGTYSAMFLMYLPPNVFGEGAYRLVTAIILLLYTGGVFYLWKPVLCDCLKSSKQLWCGVSSAFVLLTIQTVPFQGESFFWYNGSMYYTGYFALTLFFFGMLCRYLLTDRKRYIPAMAFGAVFLAGGNYVSLLPCILLTLTAAALLWKNHRKQALVLGCMALLMVAGLAISAAAPGNQNRQEQLWNMSAIKAILKSLLQGISYLAAWLRGFWFITAILLTPFFWHTYEKIRFRFPYPLIVLGYLYGIFCSMSCPTFYAMNSTGPARALAVVYYGFMLFTLMGYYYLLGYVHRLCGERAVQTDNGKRLAGLAVIAVCVLLVLEAVSGGLGECSSVKALRLLWSGEAQAYEEEYQQRLSVLLDDSVRDVVFLPYEHRPDMLYVGDFTGDVENINNVRIAEYFHKDSIMVQYYDDSAEYEYPSEFSMGDNLKTAITQIALSYDNFDQTSADSEWWKEWFVASFIQNSRSSFDYLDMISDKNNGEISAEELNYIHYSLTNVEVDFSSYADGTVNRYDASSALNYGEITDWDYEDTEDGVIVTAVLEVGVEGVSAVWERELTVNLVRNPNSCFDGYSVVSLSSRDITSNSGQEGGTYVFYGTDMMEEDNGVFAFEFLYSEDNLGYGHFVYADMTELPELAELVRQNAGSDFKVTFLLSGEEAVISHVVPIDVALVE